ncbi:hypothetical protein AAC387_Pa06g1869 [Persea americana]
MGAPSLLAQCLLSLLPSDKTSHDISTISERDLLLPSPAVEILPSKNAHPYNAQPLFEQPAPLSVPLQLAAPSFVPLQPAAPPRHLQHAPPFASLQLAPPRHLQVGVPIRSRGQLWLDCGVQAVDHPTCTHGIVDGSVLVRDYCSKIGDQVVWAPVFRRNLDEGEIQDFAALLTRLSSVCITDGQKDRRVWTGTIVGSFTVASFFLALRGGAASDLSEFPFEERLLASFKRGSYRDIIRRVRVSLVPTAQ